MMLAPAAADMLFGVDARDAVSLALGPTAIGSAALVANVLPARRATTIDPTLALQME
jgi:hypothetical protein